MNSYADIRGLAESVLDQTVSDRTARIRAQQVGAELARFALAVLDALREWDAIDDRQVNDAAHDFRAAVARSMEASRG